MVTTAIIESLTTRQPSNIIVRQKDGKIILELWKKPITLFGRVILRKAKLLKTVAVCESCNDSYVEEYSKFVVDCFNENPTGNRILDLLNLALALNTEAGEYGDVVKKAVFFSKQTKKSDLCDELGDIAFYFFNTLAFLKVDLKDVLAANMIKIRQRYPNGRNKNYNYNIRNKEEEKKKIDDFFQKLLEENDIDVDLQKTDMIKK